jgi:hypothetical protein
VRATGSQSYRGGNVPPSRRQWRKGTGRPDGQEQPTARAQQGMHLPQRGDFILDVFRHIEMPHASMLIGGSPVSSNRAQIKGSMPRAWAASASYPEMRTHDAAAWASQSGTCALTKAFIAAKSFFTLKAVGANRVFESLRHMIRQQRKSRVARLAELTASRVA